MTALMSAPAAGENDSDATDVSPFSRCLICCHILFDSTFLWARTLESRRLRCQLFDRMPACPRNNTSSCPPWAPTGPGSRAEVTEYLAERGVNVEA
jgi:hypothetical protein